MTNRQRQAMAELAARLWIEGGGMDLAWAKTQAAGQLGLHRRSDWPDDDTVWQAAEKLRHLFGLPSPDLAAYYRCAQRWMTWLGPEPVYLVGELAAGFVVVGTPIQLLLPDGDGKTLEYRFLNAGLRYRHLPHPASACLHLGWQDGDFELQLLVQEKPRHQARRGPRLSLQDLQQQLILITQK